MVPFAGLLAALEQIPDPRRRQGQRSALAPLLLFAVLAVLAGATSSRRIRLFIGVHRERLNAVFGAGFRRAPAVNTLRTLFHALDPTEIEAAFRAHAEQLGNATAAPGRRVIALDGETLRGSFEHPDDRAAAQVLSAFAGEDALILAHQEIAEGDEIAAAQALIERLGLRGVLLTADALHCRKNLRRHGRDRQRAAGAREGRPAAPARVPGRPVRRPAPDRSPRHHRSSRPRSRGASPHRGLRRRAARSRLAALRRLQRACHAPHLCTDPDADPLDVLRWFVRRWSVEVTFAEVRRHLGVESQRQWSDLAIARTTPALLGLFSLVTLWAGATRGGVRPRSAAWYPKPRPTFSDALAAVRYRLWTSATFATSRSRGEVAEIPRAVLEQLVQAACYPA